MKKFLSLVLALVMTASLVTVSAGAKEFTDDKDITYDEAVAVISEIGVVDGYTDGTFNPTGGLTRGAAAKIICNLILGPTTAAELHADTAPYPDVPLSNTFAGYIAYCAKEGIISGYADGTFKPANPLTGYAFMKMLLGALGYDSTYEGYTGANWSVNVAKQAIGIGLNKGLVEEFNGADFVNREEAALYAFNTLQATMVGYDQKITTNVNGVDVTITQGAAKPVTWSEGKNYDGNIKRDGFVQFAEEYFTKLVRDDDHDDFMRPANTWVYDKTDIGTYARYDLLVESYTTGVTGKDAYDLLKSGVINENKIESYVDGKANSIKKNDLVRSNNDNLANTGDGVVTEIYLDSDNGIITFVSVNTYLAKATADYSESKEYAPMTVYVSNSNGDNFNVDVEQVANVVDVKVDTFYQVNVSYKDDTTNGEVKVINDVEILEDSTVTKFSLDDKNNDNKDEVVKVTVGGEEYKSNVKAFYDDEVLNEYDAALLTNATYNVYVDSNGYFIGVDLFEGTKNYVFITGFDLDGSHIAQSTATAGAIFLDGTMKPIKVNVKDTNANIKKAEDDEAKSVSAGDGYIHNTRYFDSWTTLAATTGGVDQLNQWYTYTESDGVYTLKPAVRMTWTTYPGNIEQIIRTSNLAVVDNGTNGNGTRVYGEDATVFLTVDTDDVSLGGPKTGITEVTGVYTGVQSVDIEVDTTAGSHAVQMGQIFTVYDSDYYVVGAVVIGEAVGGNENLAFILSGAKSEEYKESEKTYYWEFDAFMGDAIKTFTAKSKYPSSTVLKPGTVQELRFDGDYVVNIKDVDADKLYTNNKVQIDGQSVYAMTSLTAVNTTLNLQGRTFYLTADRSDVGLALAADAKAVVIQDENKKTDVKTEFTSVGAALSRLADPDKNTSNGLQFKGNIYAALDSRGVAKWVVFDSATALSTGSDGGYDDDGTDTTLPSTTDLLVEFNTVAGHETGAGRYDATNKKLYLQFTSLTPQASKVNLSSVYVSDEFGTGKYVDINNLEVIENSTLTGTTSKVYVMDFAATTVTSGIVLGNKITVSVPNTNETVTEYYVKYGTGVDKNASSKTVANAANAEFTYVVEMPDGVTAATVSQGSNTNVTDVTTFPVSAITADVSLTAKLTAANTAPVIGNITATPTKVALTQTIAGVGTGITSVSKASATELNYNTASQTVDMPVVLNLDATTDDEIVVSYTVNGVAQSDYTLNCVAGRNQTLQLPIQQASTTTGVDVTVTSVVLKKAVTLTGFSANAHVTAGSYTVKTPDGTTVNDKDAVAIGTKLTVEFTATTVVSATTVSMNGGAAQAVNASGDKVTFEYTVIDGTNTITVTAAS